MHFIEASPRSVRQPACGIKLRLARLQLAVQAWFRRARKAKGQARGTCAYRLRADWMQRDSSYRQG